MSWTPGQRLEIANPTRSWSPRRLPAADDGEAVASRAAEVVCSRRLQPSVQATYLTVIWRGETGTACSASVAVALPLEPFHRSARRRIRPCPRCAPCAAGVRPRSGRRPWRHRRGVRADRHEAAPRRRSRGPPQASRSGRARGRRRGSRRRKREEPNMIAQWLPRSVPGSPLSCTTSRPITSAWWRCRQARPACSPSQASRQAQPRSWLFRLWRPRSSVFLTCPPSSYSRPSSPGGRSGSAGDSCRRRSTTSGSSPVPGDEVRAPRPGHNRVTAC